MARTHLAVGVSAIAVASYGGVVSMSAMSFACGMFGSLLPDVDHPSSTFGRKIRPVSDLIGGVFGHRGITHSAIAVLLLFGFTWQAGIEPVWARAFAIGYSSHLLADWFTPKGIPFLWPAKTCYRSPFTVRTGGVGEMVLGVLLLLATGGFFLG